MAEDDQVSSNIIGLLDTSGMFVNATYLPIFLDSSYIGERTARFDSAQLGRKDLRENAKRKRIEGTITCKYHNLKKS